MEIINYLLEPYSQSSLQDILLELVATVFGIASVIYAKKEKIAVFPTGIISTSIYVYVCWVFQLYGDFIINIYYTLMSVYGWYLWANPNTSEELHVTHASKKDWFKSGLIFLSTAILVVTVYKYYDRFDRFTDYADTITTGVFFAAMWLMANKKIEHWLLWIVANSISIPLYLVKGLGFTSLQYLIFLILAIQGWYEWKKTLRVS